MKQRVRKWMDSFDPYHPDKLKPRSGLEPIAIEESRLKQRVARYFIIALIVFLVWAFFAPLDAGVHVTGSVVVQGNRKAVQHPQGGVVQEILVKDGMNVNKGDTLIRINPLSAQAALNSAELDYINALCEESRLFSERELADHITWLSDIDAYADTKKVEEAKQLQSRLFQSRRDEILNKIQILEEQVLSFEDQIGELKQIIDIRKHQLKLVSADAENNATLAKEGYVSQSRANELERSRSDLVASIATTTSDISKTQFNITSTRLQISQERSTYFKEIDGLLKEIQHKRKASRANLESLKFNLSLAEIKAPVGGTVVGLSVFTEGGVIKDGEVLMEIVPLEKQLVIDAKVPTNLIDKVHEGLDADIRFTAFSQTTTPVIPGTVMMVGADKQVKTDNHDSTAPPEYYLAQIETTEEGLQLLGEKSIQPGMPVDIIIKTGERTFISYILKPLSDRFAISFKED